MSKDKGKAQARRMELLRVAVKGYPPSYPGGPGRILINTEGGMGDNEDLRLLADEGLLEYVRAETGSVFGCHIRRSFYRITVIGRIALAQEEG